jgi:non-specific protein-tyrosine kinase
MKLRKALDKAKKARGQRTLLTPDETAAPPTPAPKVKKEKTNEWVAPVYSDSQSVELDTQFMLENRCVCIIPDAPEIDSYKVLRTKIQHRTRVNGWNTVMITSPQPAEGKTLTSINLAITFAKTHNQTVLLVDADLRRQSIHQRLGIDSDLGLIDHLVDNRPLKELLVWPGIEKLTLISGGKTIDESAELLGSPKMKALVEEMKARYEDRMILFEVPPVLTGADAIAFSPLVDCIIMVVEAGRTTTRDIKKSIEAIPEEKFLGFVLNRSRSTHMDKYKYY